MISASARNNKSTRIVHMADTTISGPNRDPSGDTGASLFAGNALQIAKSINGVVIRSRYK
jgi:hypothetical protein